MKNFVLLLLTAFFFTNFLYGNHLIHEDFKADYRKAITPGYYLGFSSLHDKLRDIRLPEGVSKPSSFFNSLFVDFQFSNQEFSLGFYDEEALKNNGAGHGLLYDTNRSNKFPDPGYHHPGDIEHTLYGITLGFALGDNPNLDIRIPLSVSHFETQHLDDTGFSGGIELFPNYRINKYVAWGVNFSHINNTSDFPIFDESMTSVSFEAMAESSPAYGMNWSGRLSAGHYYPSNDINENSFWLWKGSLALHYQIHQDFTFLPYFGINYSPTEGALTDDLWVDYGIEFLLMPNSPWNFSFGLAGVGGHNVIEEGMEFYVSAKGNF
jgi:hypothetical protein